MKGRISMQNERFLDSATTMINLGQYDRVRRKAYKVYMAQLWQIWNGAVWDGNLLSKRERDRLEEEGLVERVSGWNIITLAGARFVIDMVLPE